ncbi:glutamate--tRNA ligase [Nodularia spumigena CS-584]|uniref:glutamate--tRNA ligase n=1 Tax=Nodularia spumigena TaxID=70799 RepID=UPI0000EAAF0C|nr:glutamate--tRNA ligase [Nodularia spumigena]AHJ28407.1 Glutamyl-tRNA synthetase Glutamyl-tRNA(Gln) synthetase unambiguous [Nodularia spumigena CCY9414]EAW42818.1 glutamyl-tRNA synthetase [Nodularia spumigena CCY9414]MDB9342524.1 glutamate--tRNA ligase [Nodularia spumigena CS-588/06]MDB9370132.1 glutamate--tRNA ligase [Nodularia spumigena CS-586/05]MDB9384095.1 glutamate--tRNA ligase [Nodularia spumigena CS-584]
MTVRVRIAPSPTGNLHIGTARTAVFNWLFARHHGGQFILRIEDTDLERSRPEYTENILAGFRWLGLNWDEGPFFQSQRLDMYKEAVEKLLEQGLAYRCYTTSEELEALRERQKARNEAPRYDNRHRNLTPEQEAAFQAEGRSCVIRFKIPDEREIVWNDLVRGTMTWRGSDLGGDMVIARASEAGIGQPLYNFVVVIDDIDMQITHVIRGEDHIANTAKQILLYEALGAKIPEFAHTPLILNMEGRKLSKRDGVTSITDFQKMGFTAEALVNYMTLLGWSPPDSTEEIFTLETAAKNFSFERVNKAGAKFDWAKLDWLNSQYLHHMPIDKLTDLIIPFWEEAGFTFAGGRERPWLEQLVTLISQSLTRLVDAVDMSQPLFTETVEFSAEGREQLQKEGSAVALQAILTALENQPEFSEAAAQDIIKQVVKEQKLKKGLVMRSLRAALTGDVHGPDLIQSWLLLNQISLDKLRLNKAIAAAN